MGELTPWQRVQAITADWPGMEPGITVHHPSLKLRGKAIVMVGDEGPDADVWIKSDRGTQAELLAADPQRWFVPPYVGHHGWVGVRSARADWAEVAEVVTDTYRATAGKRLLAAFDARPRD